jgi:hypothetical protein
MDIKTVDVPPLKTVPLVFEEHGTIDWLFEKHLGAFSQKNISFKDLGFLSIMAESIIQNIQQWRGVSPFGGSTSISSPKD